MAETDADTDQLVIWEPQPRQSAFITCPADDVAFGGARGGGKSDGVIGDWTDHEFTYGSDAIGMAFRRKRTELVELIERAKQVLVPLGHRWYEQDKYFRGPKGGRLRFTYLERDSDADAYQGHSYTRLYPEEMGTFPSETPINKLQATLRSGSGVPCQMKGTCNPGGPGHHWVKERYRLGSHPNGMEVFRFEFENPFTGKKVEKTRVFIPSRVTDNQYLGDDYVANLYQVGSKTLVKAWLEGDWSVIEGAFFDNWSRQKHVVRPFEIPDDWPRFMSGDWGSAKPFSFGWWAIVQEDTRVPDGPKLPRGCLVRYREWYGAKQDEQGVSIPNVGLKMHADAVGEELIKKGGKGTCWLDPSAFAEDGGPSIEERLSDGANNKINFAPADNKRVAQKGAIGGWDQVRARLDGEGDDTPMMVFFETCVDSIRTLPALQHDELRPEDVDTDGEDHAPDEIRYACMSRPWLKPQEQRKEPVRNDYTRKDSFSRSEGGAVSLKVA